MPATRAHKPTSWSQLPVQHCLSVVHAVPVSVHAGFVSLSLPPHATTTTTTRATNKFFIGAIPPWIVAEHRPLVTAKRSATIGGDVRVNGSVHAAAGATVVLAGNDDSCGGAADPTRGADGGPVGLGDRARHRGPLDPSRGRARWTGDRPGTRRRAGGGRIPPARRWPRLTPVLGPPEIVDSPPMQPVP